MEGTITSVIATYLDHAASDDQHRYHSWDNCRRAFALPDLDRYHCLQLAFYLASWGMYRGSSGLLQKNCSIHQGPVDIFYSKTFDHVKCSESLEVAEADIPSILSLKKQVATHYSNILFKRGASEARPISATDTLISKIMLGTFGCVPAYDDYFIKGIKNAGFIQRKFNDKGLEEIFTFYRINQTEILDCSRKIFSETGVHYPIMKIIDMFFWQQGYDLSLIEGKAEKLNKRTNKKIHQLAKQMPIEST